MKSKTAIILGMTLMLSLPAALPAPVHAATYETQVISGVNLRKGPSTSYATIRLLPKGENIHVIEQVNSYWLKVQTKDGTIGYVSANDKYTNYTGQASTPTKTTTGANGTILKGVNFRSAPKVADNIIGSIPKGAAVKVLEEINKYWVKVEYNGKVGYISTDYVTYSKPVTTTQPTQPPAATTIADNIINFAKSLQGKVTYQYGIRDTSKLIFDCSSFTEYVFEKYGVDMKWGTKYQKTMGTAVSKSNLKKGDLVFFGTTSAGTINHVGIYIGDGQFIHNTPSANGVTIDNLNTGYWSDKYISARRIL